MAELGILDRALGAYVGLAVGDALGATVEFLTAEEVRKAFGTHREIVGGGWLGLRPGQVTDDTEMNLAVGRALVKTRRWDTRTVAEELVRWMRDEPTDVSHTCRRGLRRYLQHGTLQSHFPEQEGSNAAAVRNLPVILVSLGDREAMGARTLEQAHLTHSHPLSDAGGLTLAHATEALLTGRPLDEVETLLKKLRSEHVEFSPVGWDGVTRSFIVDTFHTVFDAFFNTNSFEACLTRVVNRGGDADTAGAIAGQLAGARYGIQGIPARWVRHLDHPVVATIRAQVTDLVGLSPFAKINPLRPRVVEGQGFFRRAWF